MAAAGVHALELGAEAVHGNAAAQKAIRQGLRSRGLKVSTKSVSKFAAHGGKILGPFGAALSGYTFVESLRGCMGD